jgi:hypothetical protein
MQLLGIARHALTTKKMGILCLPKAHQMCKSKTTHVELALPHIMRKKLIIEMCQV